MFSRLSEKIRKQKSLPALTQEAYWPRGIKYSICYPKWGTPHQGYPQPGLMGWGYLRWGTPGRGTSWPGLMGVPKVGYPPPGVPPTRSDGVPKVGYPPQGVPQTRSDGGTWGGVPLAGVPPGQIWHGVPEVGYSLAREVPPWLDLAGVLPCGQTDGWMDGQTRVKTLPSRRTTYAVGNNDVL